MLPSVALLGREGAAVDLEPRAEAGVLALLRNLVNLALAGEPLGLVARRPRHRLAVGGVLGPLGDGRLLRGLLLLSVLVVLYSARCSRWSSIFFLTAAQMQWSLILWQLLQRPLK